MTTKSTFKAYTFGAPRFVNDSGSKLIEETLDITRCVAPGDIVTIIPPKRLVTRWDHVGKICYLGPRGPEYGPSRWRRVKVAAGAIFKELVGAPLGSFTEATLWKAVAGIHSAIQGPHSLGRYEDIFAAYIENSPKSLGPLVDGAVGLEAIRASLEPGELAFGLKRLKRVSDDIVLSRSEITGRLFVGMNGTDRRDLYEIVMNLRAHKRPFIAGAAHGGYLEEARQVAALLRPLVENEKDVVFCGHSQGAAVITLAATLLAHEASKTEPVAA